MAGGECCCASPSALPPSSLLSVCGVRAMIRNLVIVLTVCIGVASAPAQIQDKVEVKKPVPTTPVAGEKGPAKASSTFQAPPIITVPGEVEISFLNGSTVRMILQGDKIEVATPYGQLAVPSTQIK